MLEAERFCNPWLSYGFRHLYDLPVFPLTGFTEIHQVFFFYLPKLDLRRHACAMGHYSCHVPFPVAVINKMPQQKQVQGERISQGIRSLKQLATVHS